jgi:hypothetical protein
VLEGDGTVLHRPPGEGGEGRGGGALSGGEVTEAEEETAARLLQVLWSFLNISTSLTLATIAT